MNPEGLLEHLRRDGLTLAVAESCTGGLLSARIVDVVGASEVFRGGLVAYGDDAKSELLGVAADMLQRYGAVSAAVAEAMAHGARDRFGADIGVAVTGVAGPTGGVPGKPVGTVWLACVGPRKVMMVHKVHFDGDRRRVREETVDEALGMVRDNLIEAEREGQVAATS